MSILASFSFHYCFCYPVQLRWTRKSELPVAVQYALDWQNVKGVPCLSPNARIDYIVTLWPCKHYRKYMLPYSHYYCNEGSLERRTAIISIDLFDFFQVNSLLHIWI